MVSHIDDIEDVRKEFVGGSGENHTLCERTNGVEKNEVVTIQQDQRGGWNGLENQTAFFSPMG